MVKKTKMSFEQKIVSKLSPSKIHYINQCRLRFTLSSLEKKRAHSGTMLFNKNTFLGILIHSVLEMFIKQNVVIDSFDDKWDELLFEMCKNYGVEANEIENLKYNLPYYTIKRAQFKKYLTQLLKNKNDGLKAEVFVEGDLVYGFADLVEITAEENKVVITDLKTGPVRSVSDARLSSVKEGYRLQLLTYGLVYWEKNIPSQNISCNVQGLGKNEQINFVFDDAEYEAHSRFLKNLIYEINSYLKSQDHQGIATPNNDSCNYCEYSTSCERLHSVILQDGLSFKNLAIVNEINCEFDDLNSKINITTNGGVKSIHRIPKDDLNSIKGFIKSGGKVLLHSLFELQNTNIKYWTKYTSFEEV